MQKAIASAASQSKQSYAGDCNLICNISYLNVCYAYLLCALEDKIIHAVMFTLTYKDGLYKHVA